MQRQQIAALAVIGTLVLGLAMVVGFLLLPEDPNRKAQEENAEMIARQQWRPTVEFTQIADPRSAVWLVGVDWCIPGEHSPGHFKVMLAIDVTTPQLSTDRKYFNFCVDTGNRTITPTDAAARLITDDSGPMQSSANQPSQPLNSQDGMLANHVGKTESESEHAIKLVQRDWHFKASSTETSGYWDAEPMPSDGSQYDYFKVTYVSKPDAPKCEWIVGFLNGPNKVYSMNSGNVAARALFFPVPVSQ